MAQYHANIPDKLWKYVQKQAKKDHVSANVYIIQLIDKDKQFNEEVTVNHGKD